MFEGCRVGVVIPSYRVEKAVAEVIRTVPEYVDVIVAVNDCSPDSTLATLKAIQDPRLVVVSHDVNKGVGAAVATGFAELLKVGIDIAVKLDGDGQMDPERMVDLVEPIASGHTDYAKGNRFLHAKELREMPLVRKLGSIALTFLTKFASGYWHVFDPQNGYLAISGEYLSSLDLSRMNSRRYFFENEMLIQLNVLGARVKDAAMPARYADEVSSMRISRVLFYFPYFLMHGFFFRMFNRYVLRDFSVIIPFYVLGSAMFAFGAVFGSYEWFQAVRTSTPTATGTIMLSVLPLILGLQLLLQGLLIDILGSRRADEAPSRLLSKQAFRQLPGEVTNAKERVRR